MNVDEAVILSRWITHYNDSHHVTVIILVYGSLWSISHYGLLIIIVYRSL